MVNNRQYRTVISERKRKYEVISILIPAFHLWQFSRGSMEARAQMGNANFTEVRSINWSLGLLRCLEFVRQRTGER